jgi:hypothetical protein
MRRLLGMGSSPHFRRRTGHGANNGRRLAEKCGSIHLILLRAMSAGQRQKALKPPK